MRWKRRPAKPGSDAIFRVFEATLIIAYATGLIITIGWNTRRSYLHYFGIDQSALDEFAGETSVNYVAYGIPSLFSFLFRQLPLLLIGGLSVGALLRWFLTEATSDTKVLAKRLVLWILPFVVLGSFYLSYRIGQSGGRYSAQQELQDPFEYLRPVDITLNDDHGFTYGPTTRGCWMKLFTDKSNIYLFYVPRPPVTQSDIVKKIPQSNFIPPHPTVIVLRLDQIRKLEILPNQMTRECPDG